MVAFARPRRSYLEYLDSPAERPRFNLLGPPPWHPTSDPPDALSLPPSGLPQRKRGQERKPPKPRRG